MHKNIKLLLLASIFTHMGANLLAPIYAIFIEKIGGTLIDAGIAVGVYAVFKGIFYFLFDKIDETKLSKRVMMCIGYALMGVGYGLYVFAESPIHVFLIQIIVSLGETVINPSWSAIIAMSLKKGKEKSIYSHFFGYRSFAEGFAAIIGALFAMQFGFSVIFSLMAMFSFGSGALSLMVDEKVISEPQKVKVA
ncbi:MFS transporter [Flammeovirga agarivorans]|uniref:MFS transporter n=1 Tax=Flammeovirga agarivorans TaxID=2726742 RepID=A0A7X8SMK6_9BACT|nr:MFS transporter [Flammeovirga agarivorans]NLR92999.1 MFS transporter [Flammeovirga agarivorans]